MTDMQETQSSKAITLVRSERLCGRFPVLSSENREDYEELLISLLEHYRPSNFMGEKLVRHLADEEWEISRLRRHKNLLIERRFRARLAYQASRRPRPRSRLRLFRAPRPAAQCCHCAT